MKSVICSIIIAALLLGGCAKQETEVHTKKTEVPAVMQTTEEIEDVKEIEQSYVSDKNNEDEWIAYSEKYGTECRFTDLYVPAKCWLVGDENMVELMSLGGIDDATVINRASIERVEHTETIAKILNQEGVKTPAYYELKLKGKILGDNKPKAIFEYLWTYSIVRRILTNPFYCGDLVNHQRERSRITKKQIKVPKEEQFIHKDAVPAIIPREIWDKVQEIIRINSEGRVKSQSNQPCHRYASLLKCGDCGSTFTAKRRKTKDKPDRIEYVCNGYHRHTHMVYSSHRINESVLDEQIYKQLAVMRDGLSKCSRQIESDIRSWMSQKNNVSKKIKRLHDSINATELEVEQILMEKIKDRENAERYERMIEKRNREIEGFKNEIAKIENIDKTIKER